MGLQGALWLAKCYPSTLISHFNWILLLFNQVVAQLSSQGWIDPVSEPVFPEKFLGYSQESNLGPLVWQSDVLTIIPKRWSKMINTKRKICVQAGIWTTDLQFSILVLYHLSYWDTHASSITDLSLFDPETPRIETFAFSLFYSEHPNFMAWAARQVT